MPRPNVCPLHTAAGKRVSRASANQLPYGTLVAMAVRCLIPNWKLSYFG